MSTFVPVQVGCPACQHTEEQVLAQSIHGPRLPQAVEEILDGRFQRVRCSACGVIFQMDAPLVFMDFEQKIWIAMYPSLWESRWVELEAETLETFGRNTIKHAPRIVREMVQGFRVRTVFGLDALREKLLCFHHDLPDAALEVFKLQLLRDLPKATFFLGHKPRLVAVVDQQLQFNGLLGEKRQVLSFSRTGLDQLVLDPLSWVSAHSAINGRAYVDLGRLSQAKL
jgi:hypothetical protein